jgi:hypothetical protein
MKRNLFSLASAAAFVLAVVFAGCTREEVKDGKDGVSAVTVRISLGESRAATSVTPGTNPTFTTGWILFTSGAGIVVEAEQIGGSGASIADLTNPGTGVTFTVPATASAVHVFGTVADVTAWPTTLLGASISSITGTVVTVADLYNSGDATKIPLYGSAAITPDGQGNFESNPQISVIAGRVEIKSIAMAYDAATVTSFKVKNIFVNYFYPSQNFAASLLPSTITNGGSTPGNYAASTPPYTTASVLYDVVGITSADLPAGGPYAREAVVPTPTADRWAYNLLAPASGTYFPHFVIEISNIDVVAVSGDPNYDTYEDGNPTFYLTVKGVASQVGAALDFTKSNVYQIEEVLFSLSDLSTIPEPADKNVKCVVTVKPWVTQVVTPIL